MRWLLLALLLASSPSFAAQYARPNSDGTPMQCSPSAGATGWEVVDEASLDKLDYFSCAATVTECEGSTVTTGALLLSDVTDPGVDTGHVFRFACRTGSGDAPTIELTRGGRVIVAWSGTCTDSVQTISLLTSEAAMITSYADLGVSFWVAADDTACGGGYSSASILYWAELEVPDASAATRRVIIVQ